MVILFTVGRSAYSPGRPTVILFTVGSRVYSPGWLMVILFTVGRMYMARAGSW